jgi:hypothetical protein
MLNLRLARPAAVVDLRRLPELRGTREGPDAAVWGAATTHAEVEDGLAPDPTGGALRAVAARIAYRAVRNRGTVGGSLCHADPAADWPSALALADAEAVVAGPAGGAAHGACRALRARPVRAGVGAGRGAGGGAHPPPAARRALRLAQDGAQDGRVRAGHRGCAAAADGALRVCSARSRRRPLVFDGGRARARRPKARSPASPTSPPARRAILRAMLDRAAAEAGA